MHRRGAVAFVGFLCTAFALQWSARAQLVLNEFMASNDTTVADETGHFEDWVELYNAGATTVNLNGWHLTDDFSKLRKWTFPDTSLAPGTFLLVWCDNDPEDGPLHATFKLDADGEQLALVDPGGNVVDSLTFGSQKKDVSLGRVPDGGPTWEFLTQPTPGYSNVVSNVRVRQVPNAPNVLTVWPNPLTRGTRVLRILREHNVAPGAGELVVYDLIGRHLATLPIHLESARSALPVPDVLQKAPPGTYFLQVRLRGRRATAKVTVLP